MAKGGDVRSAPTPAAPLPPLLRSRQELIKRGADFRARDALAPAALPITEEGATYSMAQETVWLDPGQFAVGRWDGSLSVFDFTVSPTQGPVITAAAANSASEGVQMITVLTPSWFITSRDEESIAGWTSSTGSWADLEATAPYPYDPSLGAANSGRFLDLGGQGYLCVGHANGFLSIWKVRQAFQLALGPVIDLRNPNPVNPWGLHNIRGVAIHSMDKAQGWVVTGSEDGFISVVRVPDGAVLSQTVYNDQAHRGINTISIANSELLLIGNCSVGPEDFNLWYYFVEAGIWRPALLDRTNLKVNPAAPQVFNFSTVWGSYAKGLCWFASTEEGALWMGGLTPDYNHLQVFGYQEVTTQLGSALAFEPSGQLAMVGYDLYEFTTGIAGTPGRPRLHQLA
jgi:hypothetical protein